jgi:hypothetical protein
MLLRKLPAEPEGILGMIIAPPHVRSLANGIPDFYESLSNDQGHHKCARRAQQNARVEQLLEAPRAARAPSAAASAKRCEELLFTADTRLHVHVHAHVHVHVTTPE